MDCVGVCGEILGCQLKLWPNGTPNSSQLEPSSQLRWSWLSFVRPLGLSWLELDRAGWNLTKLKFAKFSTVWPPQPTQANSRQVVLFLLCGYVVVFRQFNGFLQAGATWWYRLATCRCKFWFCNLAWVGNTVWPRLNDGTQFQPPQTIPSPFVVLILSQFPTHFGNGLWTSLVWFKDISDEKFPWPAG